MAWFDFYKLFQYAFTKDPLAQKKDNSGLGGAGFTSPDVPDIRSDGASWGGGGGQVSLRDTKEMIDINSVSSRANRYQEYERLRGVAEIETAMTVFADESCVAGDTVVPTPAHGPRTIQWLAENLGERFLVYSYDFAAKDYTLGWAFAPRKTKTAPTVKIVFDNGQHLICTPDHRVLLRDGKWSPAGDVKRGSELMPFYRVKANHRFSRQNTLQYPRIWTHTDGWKHERWFVNEWKYGKRSEPLERVGEVIRMISGGLTTRKIAKLVKHDWKIVDNWLAREGFSGPEIKHLSRNPDRRRVVGVEPWHEIPVYDLSVEGHENFCTDNVVVHNCQKDDGGNVVKITCENDEVKEELEFLFFHRGMLNLNRQMWNYAKQLYIKGDLFLEVVIKDDNPKDGIQKLALLPPQTMYRIETTRGRLVEFQQAREGPDYQSLTKSPVSLQSSQELQQTTASRFTPKQIIHMRIGDDRATFYPYGISLIEAARGPAHQLRMMEDAMMVYRLCLTADARVRTATGYKYIKDITPADQVYYYANGTAALTNVVHCESSGVEATYTVVSKHVKISGNDRHPVLVVRNGIEQYVRIRDLHIGTDHLILVNNTSGIPVPRSAVLRPDAPPYELPATVTADLARLLGFLLVRGIYTGETFGLNRDQDETTAQNYFDSFRKYFGETYAVPATTCPLAQTVGLTEDARIPEWVFTSPEEIRKAFVTGLADAQGIRHTKDGLFDLKVPGKRLAEDIKEVWSSCGLHSGHVWSQTKTDHPAEHFVTISEDYTPHTEPVLSLMPGGNKEVFDLGVENDAHNFVANGTVVSNTRAPERRVFYIDVGQLPPFKAEAFMERMKDQFRKKKVITGRSSQGGSSPVEERWHAPSQEEDFWIPMRANSNTRVESLPGACLALDTKIPLLDGRELTLSEIITEHDAGKTNWAYSCCPITGATAPGLITWAGVTRKNTPVVRVTMDNGESVVCTPDHNFPVQGKGKTQAKDLQPGDSLFPFATRMEVLRKDRKLKYPQVYNSEKRDWEFIHRMVAKHVKGTVFEQQMVYKEEFADATKNVIHHINVNRYDNRPENLAWMNWDDHTLLHNENRDATNANISKSLKIYHSEIPEAQRIERDATLAQLSPLGTAVLQEKLKADPAFNASFRESQQKGWDASKINKIELHAARGKKISSRNKEYWSNPENKAKAFDKQKIVFPDAVWDRFVAHVREGKSVQDFVDAVNADAEALRLLGVANAHLVRKDTDVSKGISLGHVNSVIKYRGYKTISQIRVGVESVATQSEEVVWPDTLWNCFSNALKAGKSAEAALSEVNSRSELLDEFAAANAGNYGRGFRFSGLLTMFYIKQMVRTKGYSDVRHLKREAANYNHKVVSVELLDEKIDTGTLTIDGDHKIHNYHTFAISQINVYSYNSNLGEIDDSIYFRNKLFTALNFPKSYFSPDDPQTTRITLSAQDVRFARLIERLQSHIEDGLWEIADRHLMLKGMPEECYEDLKITMTPPSDWREMARAEVVTGRINNANGLKGSQLLPDYVILTKWLKMTPDEAKEAIGMMKIQKLEDLKLQILAQNPTLLGVGVPGQDSPELGAEAGGPGMMPEPGSPPPGGPPGDPGMPPEAPPGASQAADTPPLDGQDPGTPPPVQGSPLPDPSEEDLKKYDLELRSYGLEADQEDIDYSVGD